MAARRMFAKTIVDSDNFLDMPLSTQNLYFHLGMRADDDGFINNPRRIQRLIGATDDDLKLLIAKGYLITFETGVVVITHWKIHNYIQKDRYKETLHQEEKKMLNVNKNKSYTLEKPSENGTDTEWIQDGYNMDTQVRLGKERKGKAREDKESELDNFQQMSNECPTCPSKSIEIEIEKEKEKEREKDGYPLEELYIKHCPNLTPYLPNNYSSEVTALQKAIHNNLLSWKDVEKAFKMANESDFLCGRVKDWKADFKWLIKPVNIQKVLNGNYRNADSKESDIYTHDYDVDELEKQILRRSMEGK